MTSLSSNESLSTVHISGLHHYHVISSGLPYRGILGDSIQIPGKSILLVIKMPYHKKSMEPTWYELPL